MKFYVCLSQLFICFFIFILLTFSLACVTDEKNNNLNTNVNTNTNTNTNTNNNNNTNMKLSILNQYSVGNASNPQDIAFLNSQKAYITRYKSTSILIVNPLTGDNIGEIDFTDYADSDGYPEMANALVVNNKLYVAVQRLDQNTFTPTDKSYLIVINTQTDDIEKAIELTGTNPYDMVYEANSGKIYISEVGNFSVADGGIEAINTTTDTKEGFVINEQTLGGDAGNIEILSQNKGYAVITDSNYNTILISFDLANGIKLNDVFVPSGGGYVLSDIALSKDGNKLLLCDRTSSSPGIRIFSTIDDKEITANPINTGLPPGNILVYDLKTVIVLTTDYQTGSVSKINLDDLSISNSIFSIHSDAIAREYGDNIFIVNRMGQDNVLVLGWE